MKVKNYHRSKFSNLNNWKEVAWKNQGVWTRNLSDIGAMLYQLSYEATHWERGQFIELISPAMAPVIAHLAEHRTGIAEVTGSNPVEALIFSDFFFPIA